MPRYKFALEFSTNQKYSLDKDLIDDAAAYEYAEQELRTRSNAQRVNIYRQVGAVEVASTFNRTSVPDGNLQDVEQA